MGKKTIIYTDNDNLYNADQAVEQFIKTHGSKINDDERKELGELLKARARAMSEVLGVEVHSIAEKDN